MSSEERLLAEFLSNDASDGEEAGNGEFDDGDGYNDRDDDDGFEERDFALLNDDLSRRPESFPDAA